MKIYYIPLFSILSILLFSHQVFAQFVPSPKEHFGFSIGEDYHLPNFTQTESYFKKLAATSDRVRYIDMGLTEEGRHQPMLVISSPDNLAKIDRYKNISKELALAENPNEAYARTLAEEGRAVVWINGGIHASEHLSINQLIETAWLLASRNDSETLDILDNVIILLAHANPDGQELVANWFNSRPDPKTNIKGAPPYLYQKYAGHEINRDFYVNNLKETSNINRQLYIEWFPQIVFDHHQPGSLGLPIGTIVNSIPFRDPFSYFFDPLAISMSLSIGSAMHNRWIADSLPGTRMRYGSIFSCWINGMIAVAPYFHNMIGVLTETAGSPIPVRMPLIPDRQIATGNFPWPAPPQLWHFRQSINYSVASNYAVLDYAARNRKQLLLNIYQMGRNSINRGSRDYWTHLPSRVQTIKAAARPDKDGKIDPSFFDITRWPDFRDPRAYIITADPATQHDRGAVAKFINALSKNGIIIHKAQAPFTLNKKHYPENTYVVKTAQAFRPHILDMFEPQEYPTDFLTNKSSAYPPPYDVAGWTLALQMGVAYDRILEALPDSLPLRRLPQGQTVAPTPGTITMESSQSPVVGYLVSHRANSSFTLVNRLLKAGASVFWISGDSATTKIPPGTLYIPASTKSTHILELAVAELGLDALAITTLPVDIPAIKLAPTRIALWDRYSGSAPSGWVRWILEQYEYDFDLIYVKQINSAVNLHKRYDVIIFANDAIPPRSSDKLPPPRKTPGSSLQPKVEYVPEQFRPLLGHITEDKTIPSLDRFLNKGGSIVTIGSSTSLAYYLGLPVRNALAETLPNGNQRLFPIDKFYIPGSILRAQFDTNVPLAWGMEESGPVFFNRDPLFRLTPNAFSKGLQVAAWLDGSDYLLSGLAWDKRGNDNTGSVLAIDAPVGKGRLYLLTPEVTFRGQSNATFKLLFNPLHLATGETVKLNKP